MISRLGLLASSGLVAALMSTSAFAQQGGGNTIEELVVTAEKREQSLHGATAGRRAGATATFANPTAGRTGVFGQNTTYELNPPGTYGIEVQYRF